MQRRSACSIGAGGAGHPRRYARTLQDLHRANPDCARPFGLSPSVKENKDLIV